MGTSLKTTCKLCRREGVSLCGRENCAVKRRPFAPGQHGHAQEGRKPRLSSYGTQLREKQKAKRLYNVMERQFRKYFEEATGKTGNTATYLVELLERRLDNAVYRLGFGITRRQARQLVNHGFFTVNGKNVDIPSYRIRVGDVIAVKENKKKKGIFAHAGERLAKYETPKWLSLNVAGLSGKATALPEGEDLRQVFDPTLIVEFYSR